MKKDHVNTYYIIKLPFADYINKTLDAINRNNRLNVVVFYQ